jgi:hypothetical protein
VTIVTGETKTFAARNNVGVSLTSTASCSTGQLLGGGANIANNGNNLSEVVALTTSYPSDSSTWTATATVVFSGPGAGPTPSITAYALCSS